MTETVIRLRAGTTTNRAGGADKDWTSPSSLAIDECLIAPRMEPEDATSGREGRVIGWTVYAPDATDVVATDRLTIRGATYDVDGEPEDWSGGWDWKPGVVIQTRSGTG